MTMGNHCRVSEISSSRDRGKNGAKFKNPPQKVLNSAQHNLIYVEIRLILPTGVGFHLYIPQNFFESEIVFQIESCIGL